MQKKVREAEIARYNYILVVGAKEAEDNTVNVRTRGMYTAGVMSLGDFLDGISKERASKSKEPAFAPPEGFVPAGVEAKEA